MKKIQIIAMLFAFSTITFMSCKKDAAQTTTSSNYYIKGKKDGTAFNFTTNAQAQVISAAGVSIVSFSAGAGTPEGFNLGINFANGTSLATGTYTQDYAGLNYIISGVYNPNSTTYVYAAGIQATVKPLIINITTKTSTEVSGTFSGAFYKQNVSGGFFPDFITVTEGEFKLQIK